MRREVKAKEREVEQEKEKEAEFISYNTRGKKRRVKLDLGEEDPDKMEVTGGTDVPSAGEEGEKK